LGHVSTPRLLARILSELCDVAVDDAVLKATELRLRGTSLANAGDLQGAISCWNEAIELQPSHGLYAVYSNRSAARQTLGDNQGALEDATAAVELSPQGFLTAHVRKVDALYALGRIADAAAALDEAVDANPGYARTDECRRIRRALEDATGSQQ